MDKVPWNRVILEEFISIALLTTEEEQIIRSRVKGWSRVKQCHAYNMSLATLDRTIKELKRKYQFAAQYSALLPKDIDF